MVTWPDGVSSGLQELRERLASQSFAVMGAKGVGGEPSRVAGGNEQGRDNRRCPDDEGDGRGIAFDDLGGDGRRRGGLPGREVQLER